MTINIPENITQTQMCRLHLNSIYSSRQHVEHVTLTAVCGEHYFPIIF